MLPACHGVKLDPGERVISYSAGGGGYGTPHRARAWRVKRDLDEGWVTPVRASEVYGLVLDGMGGIDETATAAKRATMAAA